MALNPIDLIVGSLVLVLGLKGVLHGFRRELFAFLGLIGGVFIASRAAVPLAEFVEAHLFRLSNPAALRLVAFILVLMLVWGGVSLLGRALERSAHETPPTPLSRFGGFLLAAAKYFLIFAMILTAFYQTPLIRKSLKRHSAGSLLYPELEAAGKILLYRSPGAIAPPKAAASAPGRR